MEGAAILAIHLLLGAVCARAAHSKGRNAWIWFIAGLFFGVGSLLLIAFVAPQSRTGSTPPRGEIPISRVIVGTYLVIVGMGGAAMCVGMIFAAPFEFSSRFDVLANVLLSSASGAVCLMVFTTANGMLGGTCVFSGRTYYAGVVLTPVLGLAWYCWLMTRGGFRESGDFVFFAVLVGVGTLTLAAGGSLACKVSNTA